MRKTREHIIYRYSKNKKKGIPKKIIHLHFIPLLVAFGVLLIIFFNTSSIPYKSEVDIELKTFPTLSLFETKTKKTAKSSSQFTLLTTILPEMSSNAEPTPKPKPVVQIPVAQANEGEAGGFCLNVPVLLYHHIQPYSEAEKLGHAQLTVDSGYFDTQMAYLQINNYHSISADELANALTGHGSLPAKSIVVTIDDGYDDNYTYAFQILKKYNITGNFMLPTGLIGNNGYMTWGQLKEIADNPFMHIYNHTFSHAYLEGATKEKTEYEIETAQSQLESNLGGNVKIFTYPYGAFSQLTIEVLKEKGFIGAFSTIGGTMQCDSYIFSLRRIHIGNALLTSYGL